MRKIIFVVTIGSLFMLAACVKQTHTSTTTHYQRYNSLNFNFNGTTYNNSSEDARNFINISNSISYIYIGDTEVAARALNLSIANGAYSVYLMARKLDPTTPTGVYKIGNGFDQVTHYSFSYGTATIQGFNNRENYYYNSGDSTSSFITVTEYSTHEIKGTFVLLCTDYNLTANYPVTGDFDIIIP